jgi:asparagine synthase (glutamine-hydrolysing)
VADVEVGAFLSGGIDSSLIVAILSHELSVKPKTFTIGFDEASYDERRHARFVAGENHTEHYDETHSWDADLLKKLILDHVGQPFMDSSILPTAAVSRLAARYVKVVLSGDGGDELFSGYQRYQARALLRWYSRLPGALRRNLPLLLKHIPEPMAHHSHSLLKKAHLFFDIVARQNDERPYIAPIFYTHAEFERLAPSLAGRGHAPPGIPEESRHDNMLEMMAADALVYLPQDILTKVDRASMAYSIEARAPFLDREVVELAFSFPPHWHRSGLSGKKMLHRAFHDIVPRRIWKRRKQGFGVPIHRWFRGELGADLTDLTNRTDSCLERRYTEKLLKEHRRGLRDHGYRLWGIYVYLLWKQKSLKRSS